MKQITVQASRQYDVLIGPGLLTHLGQYTTELGNAVKVCIVSDTNVWPLYGQQAKSSLESSRMEVFTYIIPAGEEYKNGNTYLDLLNALSVNRFTRSDIIVALGGGVVGSSQCTNALSGSPIMKYISPA